MAKASPSQVKKERNPKKVEKVIQQKTGKKELPKGKVLHHVKAVVEGGKTTLKNTRIVSEGKHKKIHKNRRKRGEV